MTEKIDRAGIIPYYFKGNEILMLFMKPSDANYGGPEYQIGKGKVDPGETPQEAALREGREELGLFKGNIAHLENLGKFLGRTTIFIAEIKQVDMFGDTDDETEQVKWMAESEFLNKGRRLHRPIVQATVRRIKQIMR